MALSGVAVAKSKGTPAKSAYLYVVRGNIKLNGALMNAWFYLDGHKIADLHAKQYAVIPITPGRHEIALRSDTNYKMNKKSFTVKAGESIYYEAGKTPGRLIVVFVVPILDMGITKAYSLNKLSQKAFGKAEPSLKKIKP